MGYTNGVAIFAIIFILLTSCFIFLLHMFRLYRSGISSGLRNGNYHERPKENKDDDRPCNDVDKEGSVEEKSNLPDDPDGSAYLEPIQIIRDATHDVTPGITNSGVEGILNRLLDSGSMQTLIRSVPVHLEEYDCTQPSENLLKNWCKNILPCNSTRVILTPLFDIQSTDYINASHIEGFGGGLEYIASQGPLDTTVGDFWRMIWEQRVSAVIMAANFHETSEMYPGCRLAEYIRVGPPLQGSGFTVTILKSRLIKEFSSSTVQIEYNGATHTLEHYHHPKWEKNPHKNVTRSLAAMLRHFLDKHKEGKVVVHCTDGFERTGTVLAALLLMEMIKHEKRLDVSEVFTRLRRCRPGLLKQQEELDLALATLDELLHGLVTAHNAYEFKRNFMEIIKRSKALFKKAQEVKSFPNPETVQRPPRLNVDSCRVMLDVEDTTGDESLDKDEEDEKEDLYAINQTQDDLLHPSQRCINAVWVDGYDRRRDVIVTQHPPEAMRARFWRLVLQNRCHDVVLANNYLNGDAREYPALIPGEGGEATFGECSVQVLAAQAPAQSIIEYQVKVTLREDEVLMVRVYKITDWLYGRELPQSPGIVNSLTELLHDTPSTPHTGPKLFCCGDGVTASGLLVGALCVLQRLRSSQEVDIYRTVISLRRFCREFITSESQFEHLYSVAVRYIDSWMIYEELE
ncbi:receptor-type tyrosine-protein phosphatase S-like [Penaeus monodon]|uniref:receptor-type tyrosine-protein phosphatase S-like n=1 Tax=Penaeus monodon TaxID=6687 RepID=UPI0018A7542B|nr:receptor-type tyrosine-protein phosphatase S-like [Penaeus monodon]